MWNIEAQASTREGGFALETLEKVSRIVSPREYYELGPYEEVNGYDSRVHVEALDERGQIVGYVFVIQPHRKNPKYKMPGGSSNPEDEFDPAQTAVRELWEETGLVVLQSDLLYAGRWTSSRSQSVRFLFVAQIPLPYITANLYDPNRDDPPSLETNGEVPKYFSREEAGRLLPGPDFLSEHLDRLLQFKLLERT